MASGQSRIHRISGSDWWLHKSIAEEPDLYLMIGWALSFYEIAAYGVTQHDDTGKS